MIDRGVTVAEPMERVYSSAKIITRSKCDQYAALDSNEKICHVLACGIDDILEFIPDEKKHATDI